MWASIAAVGWRGSFYALGAVGLLWAVWWFRWYRDDPAAAARSAAMSVAVRRPWRGSAAIVVVQYFCSSFTFFLCFSWLLPYLRDHFHLGAQQAAWYASVPLY